MTKQEELKLPIGEVTVVMVVEARSLVQLLRSNGVEVNVAIWVIHPETRCPQLKLCMPLAATDGPRACYKAILDAYDSGCEDGVVLSLHDIYVLSPQEWNNADTPLDLITTVNIAEKEEPETEVTAQDMIDNRVHEIIADVDKYYAEYTTFVTPLPSTDITLVEYKHSKTPSKGITFVLHGGQLFVGGNTTCAVYDCHQGMEGLANSNLWYFHSKMLAGPACDWDIPIARMRIAELLDERPKKAVQAWEDSDGDGYLSSHENWDEWFRKGRNVEKVFGVDWRASVVFSELSSVIAPGNVAPVAVIKHWHILHKVVRDLEARKIGEQRA